MARIITDTQLARIGPLQDLDAEQVKQALADAETIYRSAAQGDDGTTAGADDGVLRKRAEHSGITPDRFNLALRVLEDQGRVTVMSSDLLPPEPQGAAKTTRKAARGKRK